jgi:outer membrane lipoprotein-sorting protein
MLKRIVFMKCDCMRTGTVKRWQKLNQGSNWLVSMLALAGVLSLGVGSEKSAIALPSLTSNWNGYVISAAPAQTAQPPQAMINSLRQSLSKQTGIPAKKLRVIESSQKNWTDGCLGLAKPDEMCTQILVPGWRVVFSNGIRRWIYRTDATGKNYRLETATQRSLLPNPTKPDTVALIKPVQLTETELPPRLKGDEIFRVIASGGFTGQTRQTTLLKDGRVLQVRLNPDGSTTKPEIHRIASIQVAQFQQLVQRHLPQFDRYSYPATSGSADFITITLSSPSGTVRYADIVQSQLPRELQAIIQTWGKMER